MQVSFGIAIGLALVLFLAPEARSDIQGSAHDLTSTGPGYTGFDASFSETDICRPCHTPHTDPTAPAPAVLWNHTLTTEASLTLRAGQSLSGTVSINCLSCHDGTVGVDDYGGSNTTPGSYTLIGGLTGGPGNGDIGTDMNRQHPVGIPYVPGGDFNSVAVAEAAGAKITDNGNTVQCNSCHDPHLTTFGSFLRATNANSALCLGCHNK